MAGRKARRSGGRGTVAYVPARSGVTTYATETWTGTNGAAWPGQWTTQANSGTVDIQSNKGRQLTTATGFSHGPSAYLSGMTAVADMEIVTSFTIPSDNDVYTIISLRCSSYPSASSDPTTGYELVVYNTGNAWIRCANSGTFDVTTQTSYFTGTAGMVVGVRFQIIGSALKAKVWDKAGSEPSTWTITATDTTITGTGKVGLAVFNGSATAKGMLWDDLSVTTPSTSTGTTFLDLGFAGNSITPPWDSIEAATLPRQAHTVTSPVRTQAYACYLEEAPGDVWSNGSVRSMLGYYYPAEDGFKEGDDYYFAFSMYFPVAYAYDNGLWELHQRSQIYNVDGDLSLAPHAVMQRDSDIEYRLMAGAAMWDTSTSQWTRYEYYGDRIKLLSSYPTNTWIDFIIHVKFSTSPANGVLQIYRRVGTNAWPTVASSSYTSVGTTANQYFDPGPVPTLQWIPAFSNQYFGHTNDPAHTSNIFSDLYPEIGIYSGSTSVPSTQSVVVDGWRCCTTYAAAMAAFPTPH